MASPYFVSQSAPCLREALPPLGSQMIPLTHNTADSNSSLAPSAFEDAESPHNRGVDRYISSEVNADMSAQRENGLGNSRAISRSPRQRVTDILGENTEDDGQQMSRKRPRPDNPRSATAYPRKRAVAACKSCRARKIKCNNARPSCGSCLAAMAPCVYEDRQDLSSFDPASILILDRLNQVLVRLDQSHPSPSGIQDSQLEPPLNTAGPRISSSDQELERATTSDSYDELHIPSARTTPDSVLQWPIFENRYPQNYLTNATFASGALDDDSDDGSTWEAKRRIPRPKGGIDEDAILDLVQRFLDLVHIKNPILDPETIWNYAQRVTEEGIEWDSSSCLVLLACALGSISRPFPSAHQASHDGLGTSLDTQGSSIREAEKYFNLARRRLGLLGRGIRASQCYFLAGIYLMYTMRPLSAWFEFHSATRAYQVYLRCQASHGNQVSQEDPGSYKRRCLEQRLYWSCYKSECEFRVELDMPNSLLADFHYPDLYPSPPDVPSPLEPYNAPCTSGAKESSQTRRSLGSQRQHEQSWFYYLTEITLRRIANRVLNVFYRNVPSSWTEESLPFMVPIAREFEQQMQHWHDQLPPLIRFDDSETPTEELPYMVYGRALEIRTWIYRPFVFYAIHSQPSAPGRSLVMPFVEKGLACNMQTLSKQLVQHRHHGTWYGLRAGETAMLSIIGAVQCGTLPVPQGWQDALRMGISRLKYWEDEVVGLTTAIEVIEGYIQHLPEYE